MAKGKTVSGPDAATMGIEVALPPQTEAAAVAGSRVVDRDGVPYCPDHHCRMIAHGGDGSVTYYKCRVPGCEHRGKNLRGMVPANPVHCPQRTCQDEDKAWLVVVHERTSLGQHVMRCPVCGFETHVPRVGFTQKPKSEPVEDFADR